MSHKNQAKGNKRSYASKRTVNPGGKVEKGAGNDQHQDPARRLGNFGGKGEHPRTGNRGRK